MTTPEEREEWEPGEVSITALARYVVLLYDDPHLRGTVGRAVLGAWAELLGSPDDDTALAYARRVSAAADRDGTRLDAYVPPF